MMKTQPKLHVILQKEAILPELIDNHKVAVVFDILLATTTIATLLNHGAKEVIPVMDEAEALKVAGNHEKTTTIIAGESDGLTIEGFADPLPTQLKQVAEGKTIILSTTNGTVAIRTVANAKKVYAASLVNGHAVAKKVATEHKDDSIILICAGTMRQLSLEDFYGAGYFIDELLQRSDSWELTDSAKAALYLYRGKKENAVSILKTSLTGQMLMKVNQEEDIFFSADKGMNDVVPEFDNGIMIVKGDGAIDD
ncbi:2-phosphosulfolactate phosphatase [Sporosarcina sp. FSL K6-1508]|uniref:2-phosphosulfolactate phosphatase n=1 Tax=Sporosarcina sp. FSL K6-1508 TaxID=2921553 RepID=UPI0030F88594